MILRNVMEGLVQDTINYLAEHTDLLGTDHEACFCPKCRADAAAIALNHLPPKYVVTGRGETLARAESLQTQNSADILGTVIMAIHIVKNAPRHCEQFKNDEL